MKQNSYLGFVIQLFGLSALLYGAMFLVFTRAIVTPAMPLELMFAMLFVITALSHYILIASGKKNPRAFTYSFMFTSVVRLIIYGLFIILYGYKHTDIAKPFAISFFLLYILYTAFELRSILGYLKGK